MIINSGGYSDGETPLPIPNREVKPFSADGTALVTGWKSRTLPDVNSKREKNYSFPSFFFVECQNGFLYVLVIYFNGISLKKLYIKKNGIRLIKGSSMIMRKFSVRIVFVLFLMMSGTVLNNCATTSPGRTLKQRTIGLYASGTELYKKGNYIQAVYLLDQAIEFDDTFAEAYYMLGLTYNKLKEYKKALANLKKADELKPITEKPGYDEADIKFNFGLAYIGLEDYENAAKYMQNAVALRNDFAEAQYNLAFIMQKLDDKEKAYQYLESAIKSDSTLDKSYIALGVLYKEDGKIDLAKSQFQRAIKINKKNKEAYNELGKLYHEQKNFKLATRFFRKALQLDEKYIDALLNLGFVYVDMQSYELAKSNFLKVIAVDSTLPEGYINLAQADYLLGDAAGALQNFEQVLKLDPTRPLVNFQMGQIYEQKGEKDKAVEAYREEISINPKHAFSHFNLAVLLHKSGKLNAAIAEYQKYISLVPATDARAQKVKKILAQLENLN